MSSIFATDVHRTSLETASQGLYENKRLKNVSASRLKKFFQEEADSNFRVKPALRQMIVFAPHNLLRDPPFTRMDLICCRNMLIYLQPKAQERLIATFHFALNPGAVLFLGSSEGLGHLSSQYEPLHGSHKIFRKVGDLRVALDLPSSLPQPPPVNTPVQRQVVDRNTVPIDRQLLDDYDRLLDKYLPAGFLVNQSRQLLHCFGAGEQFMSRVKGRYQNDINTQIKDELKLPLATALHRALEEPGPGDDPQPPGRPRQGPRNASTWASTTFAMKRAARHPLLSGPASFRHGKEGPRRGGCRPGRQGYPGTSETTDRRSGTGTGRDQAKPAVLDRGITGDQPRSCRRPTRNSSPPIEELQSTNEELHSVNEELYTVNAEFDLKNQELKHLNQDHDNLLASTEDGTVYLDKDLRIRKFNPAICKFFKLLPQDIGRPIDHIAYHLSRQGQLLKDIRQVLTGGKPLETEITTPAGHWLLKRILPFRTEVGKIEGVVLTFTDITRVKAAEMALAEMNQGLEKNW